MHPNEVGKKNKKRRGKENKIHTQKKLQENFKYKKCNNKERVFEINK